MTAKGKGEAMAFNLVLRFTGLCAFVKKQAETAMKVVLVNARDKPGHERHYAALLTSRAFVDFGTPQVRKTRDPNFGFDGTITKFGDRDMVGFLLEGENLTIDPSANALNPNFDALNDDCPDPHSDIKSLHWMARMAEAGSGKMKLEAFDTGGENLVLARLTLTEGTLITESFAQGVITGGALKVLRWKLTNAGGGTVGRERALTEVVNLSRTVTPSEVVFRSSVTNRNIFLRPDPQSPNLDVEAWVVNQPIDDIVMDRSRVPRPDDLHFHHFYDLSAVAGSHLPKRTSHCNDAPIIGVSNPRCPVAFFNDHE